MAISTVENIDCMIGMARYPDKYFDLAIVDPPYGIGRFGSRVAMAGEIKKLNSWDTKPEPEYFAELFRVSQSQIIWGANNFTLPDSEYFIVWDKQQTVDNFASAEYAWTNCRMPSKVFRYSIHQEMATRKNAGGKIHPTQKPIALYDWLIVNYAKDCKTILDTHVGSGSSRIAAQKHGKEFIGFEIDADYWQAQEKRFERFMAQGVLF